MDKLKPQKTVSNSIKHIVMTDADRYSNTLSEHIDNNSQALKSLMLILVRAMPYLDSEIAPLMSEWHRINKEINNELKTELASDFSLQPLANESQLQEKIIMSNMYTYEVDHGEKAPSVGAVTEINGGKVTAVCFVAQLKNNQKANDILQGILDDGEICNDTYDKLIAIQNLI